MIDLIDLHVISYDHAMVLMADLYQKRCRNQIRDTLLILEHTPVITKGRRLNQVPDIIDKQAESMGIAIRNADRGGLLTYHGPGQIVVYFIINITQHFKGIADTIKEIEKGIQNFLSELGIVACIREDHPGMWVGDKKIASVGLRVSQGVTTHGISLNVSNDLSVYRLFSPCGLPGDVMTNLERVLDRRIDAQETRQMGQRLCGHLIRGLEDQTMPS